MRGKRGNLEKNQLPRFWSGGNCCTEFEVNAASQENIFVVSNPGAEQQKHYVTEACLLCTSRESSLLEKLLVDSRTLGKLPLWEENTEKHETATWKGRLLCSSSCCHIIQATRSHISHIHIPRDTQRVTAMIILLIPVLRISKDCCSWALLFLGPVNYIWHELCCSIPEQLWNYFYFWTLQAGG